MLSEHLNSFLCQLNVLARQIASTYNISLSQYFTLSSISTTGISMTDLSRSIGVDNSTLTRNINVLMAKSLVSKERSSMDGRGFIVHLTSDGDNIIDLMESKMETIVETISKDLDPQERENIIEIISKLNWKITCHLNEL